MDIKDKIKKIKRSRESLLGAFFVETIMSCKKYSYKGKDYYFKGTKALFEVSDNVIYCEYYKVLYPMICIYNKEKPMGFSSMNSRLMPYVKEYVNPNCTSILSYIHNLDKNWKMIYIKCLIEKYFKWI